MKQPALFPEPVKPANLFADDLTFKDIRVKDLRQAVECIKEDYTTHETLSYMYSIVEVGNHLEQRCIEMKNEILASLEQDMFWRETGDVVELNDLFFDCTFNMQCNDLKAFTKLLSSKKLPLDELLRIWEQAACLDRIVSR